MTRLRMHCAMTSNQISALLATAVRKRHVGFCLTAIRAHLVPMISVGECHVSLNRAIVTKHLNFVGLMEVGPCDGECDGLCF